MDNATIGIKIANGEYYPVLEEDARGHKKKLVLTTVKDDQPSVQIDLYRGQGREIEDAIYVGSLVIENIKPASKGEPEIDLIIGIDEEGNLNAAAGDLATGERQSLSVSLESLSEDGIYEVPEFELGEKFEPGPELPEEDSEEGVYEQEYGEEEGVIREEPKRIRPFFLIGFVIIGIIIIALLAFLIFQTFQSPDVPPLQAENETGTEISEPAVEQESRTAVAEEAAEPEPAPVVEIQPEPVPEPETLQEQDQIWYKIRWGDTLWDISASFYRTPWLYGKIAAENNIKNPDLIFADTLLRIPPK